MSARTIKEHEQRMAEKQKRERPSRFFGCTCSNDECKLTWIVCELPQPIGVIAKLSGMHSRCPSCSTSDPTVATPTQIRMLLVDE
jgi:hypothetical protein